MHIQPPGTLLPFVGLTANAAHSADCPVYFGDLRADGLEQVELLLQIFPRRPDARIFVYLKRLGVGLIAQFELHLVRARGHQGAFHDLLRFPVAFDPPGRWVTQVPDETAGSRRFRDTRFLLFFLLLLVFITVRALLLFLLLTGEGSDDLARSGEEAQGDLALRLFLQIVMDNHAIGGILPGVEVLPHLLTRGYLLLTIGRLEGTEEGEVLARSRRHVVAEHGQETRGRARLKEMNTSFAHLIAHLT